MTRRGNILGALVLLGIASAVGYTAWRLRTPTLTACDVCTRPMHERSKAVGLVNGQRRTFCCPACALTADRQLKGGVKIVELTDYATDKPIKPEEAYMVVASDTNHCVHQRVLFDSERQPSSMDFDRCSPSMIAFSTRQDANSFMQGHGGSLERFSDIAAARRQ